jgi:hypothetical protein
MPQKLQVIAELDLEEPYAIDPPARLRSRLTQEVPPDHPAMVNLLTDTTG